MRWGAVRTDKPLGVRVGKKVSGMSLEGTQRGRVGCFLHAPQHAHHQQVHLPSAQLWECCAPGKCSTHAWPCNNTKPLHPFFHGTRPLLRPRLPARLHLPLASLPALLTSLSPHPASWPGCWLLPHTLLPRCWRPPGAPGDPRSSHNTLTFSRHLVPPNLTASHLIS